ncbi:MAG TPA: 50S ribosomal protein L31e [Thermoproteota archaeon]|nr:50S ribosomal protein L31e [Thermoproteota archaeon]
MPKKEEEPEPITLDLSKAFKAPVPQRAESAARSIRREVLRRFDAESVKIDSKINESLWRRSRAHPPRKIKVQVRVEDDVAYVEPPSK